MATQTARKTARYGVAMPAMCGFCQHQPATVTITAPAEWHETMRTCKPCASVAAQIWAMALDESTRDVLDDLRPVAGPDESTEPATDAQAATAKSDARLQRGPRRPKRSKRPPLKESAHEGDPASIAGG